MNLRSVASVGDEVFAHPVTDTESGGPGSSVRPAVLRAIDSIQQRYFEPITLSGLAAEVFVSPFHFARVFAQATGVTPGRFLTAVRLFEAKRLLLTTSLTVSDIVCSVGYSSVGTFTSRFSRAVGMTPTQYREPEVAELLVALSPTFQRLPSLETLRAAERGCAASTDGDGVLSLGVRLPAGASAADVLVGVFADAVPQCGPVAFGALTRTLSGELFIQGVPDGQWTVIAVAKHSTGLPFSIGSAQFRSTRSGRASATIRLRPPAPTDPPIAITLASRLSPGAHRMPASLLRVAA
jgi:AraC family transcriptional regulator